MESWLPVTSRVYIVGKNALERALEIAEFSRLARIGNIADYCQSVKLAAVFGSFFCQLCDGALHLVDSVAARRIYMDIGDSAE